jgi:hypothetical protein
MWVARSRHLGQRRQVMIDLGRQHVEAKGVSPIGEQG